MRLLGALSSRWRSRQLAASTLARMSTRSEKGAVRRVRDPEMHRQAIVDAAAAAFAEYGYQRATLRDIAARAGVTHGLVTRHFGTKEQLFLAAVPGTRDLAHVAEGPLDTLPERIAAGYVDRMERASGTDPFVTLLRSAAGSSDAAAARLFLAMEEAAADVYQRLLGPAALESAVPFLAALLIGVTFSRYVVRRGALAQMSSAQLRQHLEDAVRGLLGSAKAAPDPGASPANASCQLSSGRPA